MTLGGGDEGPQPKIVGLKVHYTFDKDNQNRCLARLPQLITVPTLALDDGNTLGLVDLKLCLDTVIKCSPELRGIETDYAVYVYDYTEVGLPQVGHGLLSDLLDPSKPVEQGMGSNMVPGLLKKNPLAAFNPNAIKDSLEVRLKLVANSKMSMFDQWPLMTSDLSMQTQSMVPQPPISQPSPLHVQVPQTQSMSGTNASSQGLDTAQTPSAEWNYFMQANPQLGHEAKVGAVGSPLPVESRSGTPATVVPELVAQPAPQQAQSRPSSRASRKPKPPTGRPRGRPRKRPRQEGSASGYEDGTDGDDSLADQPAKKRIASTMVDGAVTAPFASAPDSLRVAASTSGSLRTFRPLAIAAADRTSGSHLQDVPRAPTPVPDNNPRARGPRGGKVRRQSTLSREPSMTNLNQQQQQQQQLQPLLPKPPFCDARLASSAPNNEDDARSPAVAMTPAAFSEDSGPEIGSSPPVPRTFMREISTPPPSSPVLPPMPPPASQVDSGFMSGGMGDSVANIEDSKMEDVCLTTDAPAPIVAPSSSRQDREKVPVQIFRLEGRVGTQDMVKISSPYISVTMSQRHDQQRGFSLEGGTIPPPLKKSKTQPPLAQMGQPQQQQLQQTQDPQDRQQSQLLRGPQGQLGVLVPMEPTKAASTKSQSGRGSADDKLISQPPPPRRRPSQAAPKNSQSPILPEAPLTMNPAIAVPPVPVLPTAAASLTSAPVVPEKAHQSRPSPPTSNRRQLSRSESSASLVLPTRSESEQPALVLPTSRSTSAEERESKPEPAKTLMPSIALTLPTLPGVPASDPAGPPATTAPLPNATSFSEAPCPPSDAVGLPTSPATRSNKNYVKKQSIKDKLLRCVENGEMPPYCSNCGAIETPTWRKINTRDLDGIPEYFEYSEKPGKVTTIEILAREEDGKPKQYRLVKKNLGLEDYKDDWVERLLCNPCGIWLSKNNKHRPQERWDKDHERLNQERRKRGTGRAPTRKKKPTKDAGSTALTSEAYLLTDAAGPEGMSPIDGAADVEASISEVQLAALLESANSNSQEVQPTQVTASGRSGFSDAASTHTRGTGTANSPIRLDYDNNLGSTRRLLFPSPKQQKERNVLEEVSANIVTPGPAASAESHDDKDLGAETATATVTDEHMDDLEHLFRTPAPGRPSTPPPKAASTTLDSAYRTPSHPTPSHRPVTRSISRSMRSAHSTPFMFKTPSRTPRSAQLMMPESPTLRRSPRINRSATKSIERERRLREIADVPADADMMNVLGSAIQDPFSDQAELDAILDKCLSHWPEFTPRKGWNSDMSHEDWNMEHLEEQLEAQMTHAVDAS